MTEIENGAPTTGDSLRSRSGTNCAGGIAGWVSALHDGSEPGGGASLARMVSAFVPSSGAPVCGAKLGDAAALGGVIGNARGFEGGEAAICGIIHGTPRWSDAGLANIAREAGNGPALVRAFERDGPDLLRHLHGEFALAVVVPGRHTAFLAVDRAGVRPLHFACPREGLLVFASDMQALLGHPAVASTLSLQSLFEYFHHSVVPAPRSIYRDVQKLLPGESLLFDGQTLKRKQYWQLSYGNMPDRSEKEAAEQLVEVIRGAVRRAFAEAEGSKFGAFLSGGLDSSSILGLATEVAGPLDSFTIGFDAEAFDESYFAEVASRHFGSKNRHYAVTPLDMVQAIPELARAYDEPFGNSSAVPSYFCAKLARDAGVDVMLAGDGGDELFGGNERYVLQQKFELYQRVPPPFRSLLEFLVVALPEAAMVGPLKKSAGYVRRASTPMPERMNSYNYLHRNMLDMVFEPDFLKQVDRDGPLETLGDIYRRCGAPSVLQKMLHYDLHLTLADNDLRKVTKTCELAGVEVRFPMLDEEVMEFSATLPPDLLIRRLKLRSFYKHAFKDFLPDPIIRKPKQGFGLPFRVWATQSGVVRDYLFPTVKKFGDRGLVRRDLLKRLLRDWDSEEARAYGPFVWYVLMLEEWLNQHCPGFRV